MDKVELEPIYEIDAPTYGVCISVCDAVIQIRRANTLTAIRYSEIGTISWHPRFKGEIYNAFLGAVLSIGLVGSLILVVYRVFTGWDWDGVGVFGLVVVVTMLVASEDRELACYVVRIRTQQGKTHEIKFPPDKSAEGKFGDLIKHVQTAIAAVSN